MRCCYFQNNSNEDGRIFIAASHNNPFLLRLHYIFLACHNNIILNLSASLWWRLLLLFLLVYFVWISVWWSPWSLVLFYGHWIPSLTAESAVFMTVLFLSALFINIPVKTELIGLLGFERVTCLFGWRFVLLDCIW